MEDLLAEKFASLELGRPRRRSEDPQTGGSEGVDKARHERRLRAHNGQIDLPFAGKPDESGNVRGTQRHVFSDPGSAGVPGGDEYLGPVFGEFPGEGVLPSASADNQNTAGCGGNGAGSFQRQKQKMTGGGLWRHGCRLGKEG